jgi:hypothetical protein
MSKSTFRNLDAMPTWKIKEILNHPLCTGIDGEDYEPVKEYLERILYARLEAESLKERHEFEQQQKALFKAQQTTKRRNV